MGIRLLLHFGNSMHFATLHYIIIEVAIKQKYYIEV